MTNIQLFRYLIFSHMSLFKFMDHTFYFWFFGKDVRISFNHTLYYTQTNVLFDDYYKEISISDKNTFFLKFFFLWNKNYKYNKKLFLARNPTAKLNRRIANIYSSVWLKVFQFCNNFLFNFFSNNMKMLVLDTNHKNFYFFLTNHFGVENVADNIDFFLPNPKNFSRWNWYVYFKIFCDYNNISAFFVSDTVLINRNISRIKSLKIPIISFMLHRDDTTVDYSFFFSVRGNDYYYMLASLFVNYAFFLSLNYKFNCFKFIYIKQIGNFVNTISHDTYIENHFNFQNN